MVSRAFLSPKNVQSQANTFCGNVCAGSEVCWSLAHQQSLVEMGLALRWLSALPGRSLAQWQSLVEMGLALRWLSALADRSLAH